jgi:Tfp pilus assembly protein PilE
MTMITPSYLGETIEYSSLHACRSTLEDPTQDTGGTAVALPNTDCVQDLNNFYTFSFSGNVTQTAFTIQAVPTGAQAGDTCGTLTIDQAGQKTPTTTGCWAN